jgi:hypothetical protein
MTILLRENISFDKVASGMLVRITEDGYMLALDFISTLTGNDRKKASQTLARVVIKPETAGLFTLRHLGGKRTQRKLINIPNALQLLLMLPKRTVDLPTRRAVAVVLAEYRHSATPTATCADEEEERRLGMRKTRLDLAEREAEHSRARLARIHQCIELTERCGPLTDDDMQRFKRAISEELT